MKKKIIILILSAAMIMALLAGCVNPNVPKGDKVGSYAKTSSSNRISIHAAKL